MAAWKDLEARLAQGLAAQPKMQVLSIYRGAPLPRWLQTPLTQLEQDAAGHMPVLVLNVKGRRVDQALCLMQLGDLERLLQAFERLIGTGSNPGQCRAYEGRSGRDH